MLEYSSSSPCTITSTFADYTALLSPRSSVDRSIQQWYLYTSVHPLPP